MLQRKNGGFTIIETVIFLSISALGLIIALTAIGGRQARVQFTDSMRSLQAFVERQQSQAQLGVNDNPIANLPGCGVSAGGDSLNCVVLGRAFVLESVSDNDSTVADYFVVTGTRMTAGDEANCSSTLLACANPQTDGDAREYKIMWGASFTGGFHTAGDGNVYPSRAFSFLRNPRSASVNTVTYSNEAAGGSILTDVLENSVVYHSGNAVSAVAQEVSAYYCFVSANGNAQAALTLEGAQIDIIFDPSAVEYQC